MSSFRMRERRAGSALSAALFLAIAALSLVGGCASSPAALKYQGAAASPNEALDRGVRWLIAKQNPNGSFGTFESARPDEIFLDTVASHQAFQVATSALCSWALIVPARNDHAAKAALEKGIDWLLAAPPVGRATGKTFYDTWAHTYLLEFCAAVLADPSLSARFAAVRDLAAREVVLARQRQCQNGGWGYYDFEYVLPNPSGIEATSFNTGAMILALDNVKAQGVPVPPTIVAEAIPFLVRARLPSGAYIYGTYAEMRPQAPYNMVAGSSGRAQVCNLALHREGCNMPFAELQAGVDRLEKHHHYIAIGRGRPIPHEAYYNNSGYYYYFGHYYAAKVLQTIPESPERAHSIQWLEQVFIDDQNADGSWFDYPLYGYGHSYATAYAVLALQTLTELTRPDGPVTPRPSPSLAAAAHE